MPGKELALRASWQGRGGRAGARGVPQPRGWRSGGHGTCVHRAPEAERPPCGSLLKWHQMMKGAKGLLYRLHQAKYVLSNHKKQGMRKGLPAAQSRHPLAVLGPKAPAHPSAPPSQSKLRPLDQSPPFHWLAVPRQFPVTKNDPRVGVTEITRLLMDVF